MAAGNFQIPGTRKGLNNDFIAALTSGYPFIFALCPQHSFHAQKYRILTSTKRSNIAHHGRSAMEVHIAICMRLTDTGSLVTSEVPSRLLIMWECRMVRLSQSAEENGYGKRLWKRRSKLHAASMLASAPSRDE